MTLNETSIPLLRRPVAGAGTNMANIETPTIALAVGVGVIPVGVLVGVAVATHKAPGTNK